MRLFIPSSVMFSHPVRMISFMLRHIPTFIIKALFTSLLELKEMFKDWSLSDELTISLAKSYPFTLGRLARPSSVNESLASCYMPREVTFLQKFICKEVKSSHFPNSSRQKSVIPSSLWLATNLLSSGLFLMNLTMANSSICLQREISMFYKNLQEIPS